jgi:hypothetical protein
LVVRFEQVCMMVRVAPPYGSCLSASLPLSPLGDHPCRSPHLRLRAIRTSTKRPLSEPNPGLHRWTGPEGQAGLCGHTPFELQVTPKLPF